jgi:chromosome partitioning protein
MIIAVMADKGGVGKTTAAHNLGCEIAHQGDRVLLIDADKQADLTELTGISSRPNVGMDAILRQVPTPLADGYVQAVMDHLDLIGTHPQMRKADRELGQRTRREYVLEDALSELRPQYRAIIVDVGHSEVVQLNVMAIADVMVVPTTPAKLDADHIINMLDEADAMRRDLRLPSLLTPRRVIVSVTRRSSNSGIEDSGLSLIQERFSHVLAPAVIPFTPRVIEASAMHLSLRAYRDQYGGKRDRVLSAAVDAYADLARHTLAMVPPMMSVA